MRTVAQCCKSPAMILKRKASTVQTGLERYNCNRDRWGAADGRRARSSVGHTLGCMEPLEFCFRFVHGHRWLGVGRLCFRQDVDQALAVQGKVPRYHAVFLRFVEEVHHLRGVHAAFELVLSVSSRSQRGYARSDSLAAIGCKF